MKKNIKNLIVKLLVVCLVVAMVPMFALTQAMAVSDDYYANTPDTDVSTGTTTTVVEVETTVDNGTAKAEVSEENLADTVESTIDAASGAGTAPVVELNFDTTGAKSLEVTLPIEALTTASEAKDASLKITSDLGSIALDNAALDALVNQADASKPVTLEIAPVDKDNLGADQKAALGDTKAEVYDLSVYSGDNKIDFKDVGNGEDAKITITLPYTKPADVEDSAIRVYYLDDEGYFVQHRDAELKDGKVVFTTTHLSTYVITAEKLLQEFSDVGNTWYAEAVDWAVGHKITAGTGDNKFEPTKELSRKEIVTLLWRAKGSPAPKSTVNPFTDVTKAAYGDYYDAILWAVEEGITVGQTATTFEPDKTCTRSEIVTFLWRFCGEKKVTTGNSFVDVTADWYKDAVNWAVANNITKGTGNNRFTPAQTCDRSQAVTLMYRALTK